ncbi:MAG: signal peptide peptidase SppA [Armatimonadetes bacterium]|nr:signal peptide peptidase SppA [Armatimonadota bacterium]
MNSDELSHTPPPSEESEEPALAAEIPEEERTTTPPRAEQRSTAPPPRTERLRTPPPAPPERRGVPPIFWGLLFGCGPWLLLFVFAFMGIVALMMGGESGGASGPRVGLVRVSGVITAGASEGGLLGGSTTASSETIIKHLEEAAKDDNVKAIVLRINSPGGSPAGSQEVYNEILRLRKEKKKPIIVSMGDVAASGGYFIAAAADHIFAVPSTMTASIGVIMEYPVLHELFNRWGVDMAVIKSGKFKDIGNIARPLSPEERTLLQTMIMDVYGQFVTAVVEGRNLPREQVLKVADGRVMTGAQAHKYKLVDELGGLKEAVRYAGKKGGIEGEPKVKEFGRKGLFSGLFEIESGAASETAQAMRTLRLLADPRVQQAIQGLLRTPGAQPGLR